VTRDTSSAPSAASSGFASLAMLASLAAIAALLLLAGDAAGLHFLQKAAGYTPAKDAVSFDGAKTYLTNIQGGIAPLAIPACLIGLTVSGMALAGGMEWGRRTLTGVAIGATIVFLGPQILA
jgi:uncharacterized membrane protein